MRWERATGQRSEARKPLETDPDVSYKEEEEKKKRMLGCSVQSSRKQQIFFIDLVKFCRRKCKWFDQHFWSSSSELLFLNVQACSWIRKTIKKAITPGHGPQQNTTLMLHCNLPAVCKCVVLILCPLSTANHPPQQNTCLRPLPKNSHCRAEGTDPAHLMLHFLHLGFVKTRGSSLCLLLNKGEITKLV